MNNKQPVYQYNYDWELVATHSSVAEASAATGISGPCIQWSIRTGKLTHGVGFKRPSVQFGKRHHTAPLKVWQWSIAGELLCEYESMRSAAQITGANVTHICECVKGRQYSTGGYRWTKAGVRLVVEPKPLSLPRVKATTRSCYVVPIYVRSWQGPVAENACWFESVPSAVREMGLASYVRQCAYKALRGERASAGGYYWIDGEADDLDAELRRLESMAIAKGARRRE